MSSSKRIIWIDIVKGVAILFLLLSHSIPDCDIFRNWISSWHMPIFFVICGYISLIKHKNPITIDQFILHLKRRWKNLWFPYILFGIILIIFYNNLNYISGTPLDYCQRIEDLLFLRGIDSLWFIPVFFFSELFFLLNINRNRETAIIILLILFLIVVKQEDISRPFELLYKIIEGSFFVFVGYLFAKNKIEQKLTTTIGLLLVVSCAICTLFNWNASMNSVQSAPLYLSIATLTSLAIITIVSKIEYFLYRHCRMIIFYGRNSLIVMCTNNLIIETLRLLDYRITGNWMLHSGYFGIICFFLILTILEYPILKFFEGKFK